MAGCSVLWFACWCAPSRRQKKYTLITEPVADGCLFVNGEFVGVSPVEVDLRSRKTKRLSSPPRRMARISDWPRRVDPKQKGAVVVRLESDAAFQATEESDVSNTWITIAPHRTFNDAGELDESKTWQKLVSLVTDKLFRPRASGSSFLLYSFSLAGAGIPLPRIAAPPRRQTRCER